MVALGTATEAEQAAASTLRAISAVQVIDGLILSEMVTEKEQLAVLPAASPTV
jgi:hypothetical protein